MAKPYKANLQKLIFAPSSYWPKPFGTSKTHRASPSSCQAAFAFNARNKKEGTRIAGRWLFYEWHLRAIDWSGRAILSEKRQENAHSRT